jgi:hypothetical protein
MKKKFEMNVAAEMPKTKLHEPELPWKLSDEDLAQLGSEAEVPGDVAVATPPFKARAVFPILLVVTVFVVAINIMLNIYIDSENAKAAAFRKDREAASLKANLEKAVSEKKSLNENSARLEKRIEDLKDQKELFTAALESLTKKSDEVEIDKKQQ